MRWVGMALGLAVVGLAGGGAMAGGPQIRDVGVSGRAARYQKVEITFRLSRSYANPFDPEEISVGARVTAPSGRVSEVPGFPYQECRLAARKPERVEPVGGLVWKVRWAPVEVGRHRIRLRARDKSGESQAAELVVPVAASKDPGYVRRSWLRPTRFAFDDGSPFFALGENVCWGSGETSLADYELWFSHLAAAGCNYARLWLAPWMFTSPIAWPDEPEAKRAGSFSLRSSWRLDQVVEMAERRGLYLMLCLDSFNSLRATDPYPAFDQYLLNAKFGGPLASPVGFFTDPEARRLFMRRLRYYVARWGYSPHVFAWEFWNEVDLAEGYDSAQVRDWHREMARYLRGIDPWDHLITTSYARSDGDPAVDGLAEMDFVQTHNYGSPDIAGTLLDWSRAKARYGKPHLVGEFGADSSGRGDLQDTDGVHLHNGLWASALSGDAGTAMTWWWDQYVEPRQLYYHFAALHRFLAGTNWLDNYRPVPVVGLAFPPGGPAPTSDLVVQPSVASWERHPANRPREYRVGPDGRVSDAKLLSQVLHGVVNHRDKHNPPTFLVDYPAPGAFAVEVSGVSGWGGAGLRISVDGELRLERDFPDQAEQDHETTHQYDGSYRVPVPAGKHRITVENLGRDWCFVAYRFAGYLRMPALRVVGLSNGDSALVWLQNKAHTWRQVVAGKPVPALPPVRVTLGGLGDGRYTLTWWDTYTGRPTGQSEVRAKGGKLTITTPPLGRDAACKLVRGR